MLAGSLKQQDFRTWQSPDDIFCKALPQPPWPPRSGSTLAFPRPRWRKPRRTGLKWRHAISTFGDIKYPADFKRFDYVNPDAPKGGVARLFELGTYDSFNIVVAGLKGSVARRRRAESINR